MKVGDLVKIRVRHAMVGSANGEELLGIVTMAESPADQKEDQSARSKSRRYWCVRSLSNHKCYLVRNDNKYAEVISESR
tara:strand:- start:208 stop:444 length:237 start_codon:yes stop_codon:yes gene_type:complete